MKRFLAVGAVLAGALLACRSRTSAGTAPDAEATVALPSARNATRDAGSDVERRESGHATIEAMFRRHPEISALDDVPQLLPEAFRKNFVLKHGRSRAGERGHLVEKRVSQSADPDAPRVIAWDDERDAFVSYNGGGPAQTNGQRLDLQTFDPVTSSFTLEGIDLSPARPNKREPPTFDATGCATCHGERLRPIFSMYPDWPAFYGSDNDELTNRNVPVQVAELADYRRFRREVATSHPRYAPLFQESVAGRAIDDTFPFRPDVREDIHAVSRAFAFRPGLRLGIFLNRLQARALIASIVRHPRYDELGRLLLANLLRCPVGPQLLGKRVAVEALLGEPARMVGGVTLHYRQALRLFDLDVRDVDIRYSYTHDGYRLNDASKSPMGVGYIGTYWNAYFDGSATIDELVAAGLYEDQSRRVPALAGLVTLESLTRKYEHLTERFQLDVGFFSRMDAKARWIPIPYPNELNAVHHRDGWPAAHRDQHTALCAALGGGS